MQIFEFAFILSEDKAMNKFPLNKFIFLILFVGLTSSCAVVSSQSSRFREVDKPQNIKQAPAECLEVFHDFFNYVRKSQPDIVTDEAAQNRFLSNRMRKTFIEHVKNSPPEENPDYPSNSVFTLVWNSPTTFSILGSRHYDFRNAHNPNDNRAVVDVIYEWDNEASLENQYSNEKSLYSFMFVFEEGAWKLDDIYTYDDVYSSAQSLRNYFQKK